MPRSTKHNRDRDRVTAESIGECLDYDTYEDIVNQIETALRFVRKEALDHGLNEGATIGYSAARGERDPRLSTTSRCERPIDRVKTLVSADPPTNCRTDRAKKAKPKRKATRTTTKKARRK